PGVDYYSLKEVRLLNGSAVVSVKMPTALNSLAWGGDFQVLRAFDGDSFTQWASAGQGAIGAVAVVGNNMKFTRLKVIGFGTKATRECFVMFVSPDGPSNHPPGFGNVIIEDCIFTDPAPDNTDGLTTI